MARYLLLNCIWPFYKIPCFEINEKPGLDGPGFINFYEAFPQLA
jgi:hypothetical protein